MQRYKKFSKSQSKILKRVCVNSQIYQEKFSEVYCGEKRIGAPNGAPIP